MPRPARSVVRRVALAVAVMTMLIAFGSNGRISSEYADIAGTRIRFAVSLQPEETRVVSELVRRFEARTATGGSLELFSRYRDRSGVQVTVESVPSGEMVDFLKEEGSGIHLFAQDNGDLAGLVEGNLVQDISDIEIPSDVIKSLIPEPASDGKARFLPFRPNVRLTYANKEAFADAGVSPPTTAKELEEVARKLRELQHETADSDSEPPPPKVSLSLSQADGGAPTAVTISELVLAFNGNPVALDDRGSIEAFSFLQRLFQDELLAWESVVAKHDAEIEYLKQGAVWLAQNWPVTSANLEEAGKLGDFEVHAGWQPIHVVGGDVLGIPREVGGDERKAAVALAEYLMSREAQAFLVERNAWPAIRQDAYELVRQTPTNRAVRAALQSGWVRPAETYWQGVVNAMNEAVRRIVYGDQDPERVLPELRAGVERQYPNYPRKDRRDPA